MKGSEGGGRGALDMLQRSGRTYSENYIEFKLQGMHEVNNYYQKFKKKLEVFGGHLLSDEDDHSHWAPPFWNITKEAFSLGRTEL